MRLSIVSYSNSGGVRMVFQIAMGIVLGVFFLFLIATVMEAYGQSSGEGTGCLVWVTIPFVICYWFFG